MDTTSGVVDTSGKVSISRSLDGTISTECGSEMSPDIGVLAALPVSSIGDGNGDEVVGEGVDEI